MGLLLLHAVHHPRGNGLQAVSGFRWFCRETDALHLWGGLHCTCHSHHGAGTQHPAVQLLRVRGVRGRVLAHSQFAEEHVLSRGDTCVGDGDAACAPEPPHHARSRCGGADRALDRILAELSLPSRIYRVPVVLHQAHDRRNGRHRGAWHRGRGHQRDHRRRRGSERQGQEDVVGCGCRRRCSQGRFRARGGGHPCVAMTRLHACRPGSAEHVRRAGMARPGYT
mmetsp:Transcript_1693/g.3266  ORF Transcript_1693/g.3266 Transcript_1693/m.3266 type:complete len:224 (-) Transcript_1693:73-744(-)